MRNQLTLTVSVIKGHIVAHFCGVTTPNANRPTMEVAVNATRTTTVPVPDKLQGSDYHLVFPLHKAKSPDAIDFAEIETIMVLNNVAHNVTSITPRKNGSKNVVNYDVVFNMPAVSTAA